MRSPRRRPLSLNPALLSALSAGALCFGFHELKAAGGKETRPEEIRFNEHIRPILSQTCFQCHGPDEKKRDADLRLDTLEGATRDLGGYAAIAPGHPEKSALLERITSHDKTEVMPPPKSKKPPLQPEEIELLRRWISEGAHYTGHWALQPLAKNAPPEVQQSDWVRNEIDRFVLQKLERQGVAPSPEAPKAVLLRRLSLDLTGIPPSPEETAAFLADLQPDAYERAVDRLLASPHYGERWGRHWLDQARYADSNGYSIDGARDMWPYRDWVIRALNEDMPFDRFTVEQIAGDLLPKATKSQIIASAFHRNSMINQEGGSNPEQFRNEAVVDRVNTTGTVWLGLTVGCAQCHSHKYDPISHQEYFRLFAFFNSGTDVNNTGQTLEVLPGEVLGKPQKGVTPEVMAAAQAKVATAKQESPARQKAWLERLTSTAEPTQWHPIHPENVTTATGRDYALQPGEVIQLSAGAKPKDVFNVTFHAPTERIEALQVRILPEAMKGKAAGFALSELEFLVDNVPVPMAAALTAVDSTKNPVKGALDGDLATAWVPETNSAIEGAFESWFIPAEAVLPGSGTLTVRLRQESGTPFNGKFQLSVSERIPLLPPDKKLADSTLAAARKLAPQTKPTATDAALFTKAFKAIDVKLIAAELALDRMRRTANPASLLVMKELAEPRPTFLHVRGDFLSPDSALGPLEANTPAVLPALHSEQPRATRLDLAKWLVRADNPLTPRVTVNRVWMRYFGMGLVETENDFGTQGTPPSHPDLLDWLSNDFINSGWSMKHLHKRIVMSAVYRQSSNARPELSERDPRNLWLARQNRVRLDAEIIRDSALKASGLLNATLGGPPVYPPQPEGVYAFTQNSHAWNVNKDGDRYRRALYTMFYRSAQHPLTSTFDAPNFSATCTRRLRSNTPLQALMLANDEAFFEMAQATAKLLWKEIATPGIDSDIARVTLAFERFLCRPPTPSELKTSLQFLSASGTSTNRAAQADSQSAAWTAFARGLMNTDEFINRE